MAKNLFKYEQTEEECRIICYNGPANKKEIIIPGFIDDKKVTEIGPYAFYQCESIEKVFFAEGVRTIGEGAFALCKNLKLIGLPDSLTQVERGAFFGCESADILTSNEESLSARNVCPFCGASASDTPRICSECGFGSEGFDLKLHLREKKEEELRQQKQREEEEEARRKEEKDRQLKERQSGIILHLEKERENNLEMAVGYSLGFIACIICTFWLFNGNGGFYYIGSAMMFAIIMLVLIVADIALFAEAYKYIKQVSTINDDLSLAKEDIERYDEMVKYRKKNQEEQQKRMEQIQAQNKAAQQAQYNREHPHPKCPMCGGTNTRRITDAERYNSTYWWGLGSDKIGKQYECLDCKHKW